jgi:hypothetical protein
MSRGRQQHLDTTAVSVLGIQSHVLKIQINLSGNMDTNNVNEKNPGHNNNIWRNWT